MILGTVKFQYTEYFPTKLENSYTCYYHTTKTISVIQSMKIHYRYCWKLKIIWWRLWSFSSYRVYVQQLSNSEIVQTKTLGTKYMCNQHRILLKTSWEPLFCDNTVSNVSFKIQCWPHAEKSNKIVKLLSRHIFLTPSSSNLQVEEIKLLIYYFPFVFNT